MQANKGPFQRKAQANLQKYRRSQKSKEDQSMSVATSQQSKAIQKPSPKYKHMEIAEGNRSICKKEPFQESLYGSRMKQCEGIICWEQFQLTPNLHEKFFCGVCRYHFSTVSEFVYHCALVCKEFNDRNSSHMIAVKPSLRANIKPIKEQGKVQQMSIKYKRNYRSDLITTIDFMDDSFQDENKPKKKIKPLEQQSKMKTYESNEADKLNNKKQANYCLKTDQDCETNDKNIAINKINTQKLDTSVQNLQLTNDFAVDDKIKDSHYQDKTVSLFQLQLSTARRQEAKYNQYLEENIRLSKNILAITEKIKQFSTKFIKCWMLAIMSQFKFDVTYRQIHPSFIFAVNPFKLNNIKSLRQQSSDCSFKRQNYSDILIKFSRHFLGNCCEYNSQNSTYLILWSDYFYESLIKTMNQDTIRQQTTKNYGFYKLLYEKTSYSKLIDQQYPNFKYYLGYLHSFIFSNNIIDVCQFCRFQCPGRFMQLRGLLHKKECVLNGKKDFGIEIRNNGKKKRQLSQNILNIENIRRYKFFCPCRPIIEQMSAEALLSHLSKHHSQQFIKISLPHMFKRSK